MGLPGYAWLRRQLSGVDKVAGGYHNEVANPVIGGAGLLMSVMPVLAWFAALVPLSPWLLGNRSFG